MWMFGEQDKQTDLTEFYTLNGMRAELSRLGSNRHYPSFQEKFQKEDTSKCLANANFGNCSIKQPRLPSGILYSAPSGANTYGDYA